jgi:hypothetical protein
MTKTPGPVHVDALRAASTLLPAVFLRKAEVLKHRIRPEKVAVDGGAKAAAAAVDRPKGLTALAK